MTRIAGRDLETSDVFDTYWHFADLRQKTYERRVAGEGPPWADDQILSGNKFTNCFRAADRVSQYLIRNVIYCGSQDPHEVVFRILLFKVFNRVSTWELLQEAVGQPTWSGFDPRFYDHVLSEAFSSGHRLYSAAYVMPSAPFGERRKHSNHLRLIDFMLNDGIVEDLQRSQTMESAFLTILKYPGIGRFLAYQYLIDINYSNVLDFEEMEFVVPGPGALDGIRKCFGPASSGIEGHVIRYMADTQEQNFESRGLKFKGLFGRRLQLIDCQNLFCEVDKYARVAHPNVTGLSGRTRIKQRFSATGPIPEPWFPPKWGLNGVADTDRAQGADGAASDPLKSTTVHHCELTG